MPTTILTSTGLRLLIEELPHTHSVSIGYFIGVGACHEPTHLSGVSHFIEHMCFKGTRSLPNAMLISDEIEGVGGILNASTSYESTAYWAKVADIHFDRAVRVLTEMVRYPLLDPHELEKERRVIIEEIRSSQDTPGEWVHNLLQEAMWGDQPLGRDIAGTLQSVSTLPHADLLAFWREHYCLDNIVISVAGNVRRDQVISAILTTFDLPDPEVLTVSASAPTARPNTRELHTNPALPGPQVRLLSRETEQGNFCLGFSALSYRHPDRRALQVLDTIVGGGMSSRLFQILREDLGLAYNIGSYNSELADTGMWVIYGGVEPEVLHDSISAVLAVVKQVVAEGVTEEEVQRVKEQVKGGILLSLEDTWSVASRNGAHQLRYGEVIPVERVVAEVEAVTRDDVLRVARQILQRNSMHLAIIGPYTDEDVARLHTILETAL